MRQSPIRIADALLRIQILKPNLTTLRTNERIEFACLTYKYFYTEITSNRLYESHKISMKDLTRCFEMHDREAVICGVIAKAKCDPEIEKSMKLDVNNAWDSWNEIFDSKQSSHKQQKSQGSALNRTYFC